MVGFAEGAWRVAERVESAEQMPDQVNAGETREPGAGTPWRGGFASPFSSVLLAAQRLGRSWRLLLAVELGMLIAVALGMTSGRGAGLAGLRERVAALGGVCEAGAAATGGWRLMISLPTEPEGAGTTGDAAGEMPGPDGAQSEAQRETRITPWFG